ncbi:MAG TPA: hypothetical protein VMG13_25840, partial [Trebonia sp.]|nr:hypothetical protein [Trebonia sp.]
LTVAAVLGVTGGGLFSGVSSALGGVGFDIWNAARREAQAWDITWLPPVAESGGQRAQLDRRGVAAPQIRKNIDG